MPRKLLDIEFCFRRNPLSTDLSHWSVTLVIFPTQTNSPCRLQNLGNSQLSKTHKFRNQGHHKMYCIIKNLLLLLLGNCSLNYSSVCSSCVKSKIVHFVKKNEAEIIWAFKYHCVEKIRPINLSFLDPLYKQIHNIFSS